MIGGDRILHAALELFAVRGYHGTTMRMLAKSVGATPAALYHYYATKDALLEDLGIRLLGKSLGELRRDVARNPGRELEAAIYYHVLSHCYEQPGSFVVQQDLRHLSPGGRARVDALLDDYERVFHEALDARIVSGDLPSQDIRLAVKAMMGLGAFVAHWFHQDGPLPAETIAEQFVAYAIAMVSNPVSRPLKIVSVLDPSDSIRELQVEESDLS